MKMHMRHLAETVRALGLLGAAWYGLTIIARILRVLGAIAVLWCGGEAHAPIQAVPRWTRRLYRRASLRAAVMRQMPYMAGGAKGIALGRLFDLVMGVAPLDWQTARNGDYLSLRNAQHLTVLAIKGQGTDNDDPTFTFQQASAVAGTGVKALATIDEYWEKEENAANLEATGAWTRVTQTAASTVAPGDPSAQSAAMYVFEIDADELDVDNDFDVVRVNIGDTGVNAQLGAVLYILSGLRYQVAPQNLPNSIAD